MYKIHPKTTLNRHKNGRISPNRNIFSPTGWMSNLNVISPAKMFVGRGILIYPCLKSPVFHHSFYRRNAKTKQKRKNESEMSKHNENVVIYSNNFRKPVHHIKLLVDLVTYCYTMTSKLHFAVYCYTQ